MSNDTFRCLRWLRAGMVVALCSAPACTPSSQQQPPSPPPSPPPVPTYTAHSPQTPWNYEPQQLMREHAPGLMVRTMYVAESRGKDQVEIWEMLVGAGKKSGPVTLPGAAVIEIASGEGVFTIAGRPREARTGDAFSIDEAQQFTIESRTQGTGLMIRATVIRQAGS
jgi:mannose-6-phosphate isomerase-like protein (cupin superfamily)